MTKLSDEFAQLTSAQLSERSRWMVTALAAAAGVCQGGNGAGGGHGAQPPDPQITVDNTGDMPPIGDVLRRGFVAGERPLNANKVKKVGKQLSLDFHEIAT